MMKKIVLFLVSGLFAALTTGAQELAYNEKRVDESAPDSTLRNEDPIKLHEVQVTGRSKLRMLRESAMPVSVIGERQLQGSANNLPHDQRRAVRLQQRIAHLRSRPGGQAHRYVYRRGSYVAA